MRKASDINEAAAIATDDALGASNFGETVAGPDEAAAPAVRVPGPYIIKSSLFLYGRGGTEFVCTTLDPAMTERIAYCLNIVEESEKTDRVA